MARSARCGSATALEQTQLDVYGELLDALYLYREQLGELHPRSSEFVADLADTAAAAAGSEPDRHLEMRGEPATTSPRRCCAGWRSTAR